MNTRRVLIHIFRVDVEKNQILARIPDWNYYNFVELGFEAIPENNRSSIVPSADFWGHIKTDSKELIIQRMENITHHSESKNL